ncbi:MAG TPA: hypothetical protein VF222_11805 [Nitrososphaeraceae archaeon]
MNTHSNILLLDVPFHQYKVKKLSTNKDIPIRITTNPLIVQFELLYIKERLGPTKDLL